jgi:hypothetical protein
MNAARFVFIALIALLSSLHTQALSAAEGAPEITVERSATCDPLFESRSETIEIVKRGCCSHHSGVCGCSGGRAQCCDGTQSPSCGCAKNSTEKAMPPQQES